MRSHGFVRVVVVGVEGPRLASLCALLNHPVGFHHAGYAPFPGRVRRLAHRHELSAADEVRQQQHDDEVGDDRVLPGRHRPFTFGIVDVLVSGGCFLLGDCGRHVVRVYDGDLSRRWIRRHRRWVRGKRCRRVHRDVLVRTRAKVEPEPSRGAVDAVVFQARTYLSQ